MAKSFPSVMTRSHARFSAMLLALLLTMGISRVAEPAPLNVLPGPARIELDPGKVWLDVPSGYVYVNTPDEIRKADDAADRAYDTTHVAVAAHSASGYDILFTTSTGADALTWQDAPSTEWKDRLLVAIRALVERTGPAATEPARFKVLGWYAEPSYTPGPPRRVQLPLLIENQSGGIIATTLGCVGTATCEINLVSQAAPQDQPAASAQMTALMDAIRFELPPVPVAPPPQPTRKPAAARQNEWGDLEPFLANSVVGKAILTAVGAVGAAALAFSRSIGRLVRKIFGRGDEFESFEERDVRPQIGPPPPPAEGEFPGT